MNASSNHSVSLMQYLENTMTTIKSSCPKRKRVNRLTSKLSHSNSQQNILERLTHKELEVLRYLIQGYSAKTTGKVLFISPRTVERHWENMKIKLDCHNKGELVKKALENML